MKLRLYILTEDFYPAMHGSTTQLMLLGRELVESGHEVTIVTRRLNAEHARKEKIDGYTVYRVPPSWGMSRWGKYLMLLPAFWRMYTQRRQFDLILVSGFAVTGILGVIAAKLLAKKCILRGASCGELDGSYAYALDATATPVKKKIVSILAALRNPLIKSADCFLSISSAITVELLEQGISKEKVVEFGNGVDSEVFRPASQEDKIRLRHQLGVPDRFLFAYCGRLAAGKGLETLLEAWRQISPEASNAHLLLVGSGQGYAMSRDDELRAFVTRNHLDDFVTFTGNVSNVQDYLRAADCFVFPTEYEALGNSVIEAISCGLACVASRVGGVPDVVADGINGILVPRRDPESLARAMFALYSDDERRNSYALASRSRAMSKFSLEAKIKILEDTCSQLLKT
jgi:glycosyltransferase involved in cell wall biosynthesis